MDIGVGGHRGADVDADGRGVNELYLADAFCLYRPHMGGKLFAADDCLQAGNQAFQNQGGLAGAGHAGHRSQPSLGNADREGLYGVDGGCGKGNFADVKHADRISPVSYLRRSGICEEGADLGMRISGKLRRCPLGNHPAPVRPGSRAHLDEPVGFCENLGVMVYQNHGISIGNQVLHDAGKPHNVGGMQADGRFVQHVEHAGGPVPHGPRQLHPLPLSGGEGGGGAIKGQIAQAQIHEPLCYGLEGFADALRHGTHFFREGKGDVRYPLDKFGKGHFAGCI